MMCVLLFGITEIKSKYDQMNLTYISDLPAGSILVIIKDKVSVPKDSWQNLSMKIGRGVGKNKSQKMWTFREL